jgi:DNA polymerase
LKYLPHTIDETLSAVQTTLKQMGQWGCRGFDPSPDTLSTLDGWRPSQIRVQRGPEPLAGGEGAPAEKGPKRLDDIKSDLGDCQRCALAAGRTHIVFGDGSPTARLVFVGEGPGAEEDRQGLPFVGAAGQLLDKIIAAMNLVREQVYICNVIKCRPPGNRNPEAEEINACQPFLKGQLTAIAPEVICTLGAFASRTLLDTDMPISRLRGRFHAYGRIKVMPTYHPAYLLRHPDQKRAVWEDMKKIMALLRIPH